MKMLSIDSLTMLDYFAVRAPEMTKEQMELELNKDRLLNPHADSYKPKRRNELEIKTEWAFRWAEGMLEARKKHFERY